MGPERIVTIGANHPSLAGHFPGHPVVPGVVMLGEIMNAELPLLLKEMRATTENLNALVEHARDGVEHAAVLLHAAGALGDTVQRVHETVQGTSRSFLVNLAGMVAGFRATTDVVKAHMHREGGTFHDR